jgi:dienelactone hydrolase
MTGESFEYRDGDTVCEGYVARPADGGPAPCVLVAHQWAGLSEAERDTADRFAALGYVGFAIDVYGKGRRGDLGGDNSALMNPFLADRAALRQRLLAAVDAAAALPGVDPARIAMLGYCFGGLCALDVARSGTDKVKGAVSVHGIFAAPNLGPQPRIHTKVLILHGWEDPMATPEATVGVAKELTDAGADWQLHAYGHAMHSFTHHAANAPERGVKYDANADRRSWAAATTFMAEVIGDRERGDRA